MEKTDKNVKKTGKKLKIKRITGQKPSKISKNRQKCQKTREKSVKNVKKTGKKLKIKRITGQKPSQKSKNRQKCQKT